MDHRLDSRVQQPRKLDFSLPSTSWCWQCNKQGGKVCSLPTSRSDCDSSPSRLAECYAIQVLTHVEAESRKITKNETKKLPNPLDKSKTPSSKQIQISSSHSSSLILNHSFHGCNALVSAKVVGRRRIIIRRNNNNKTEKFFCLCWEEWSWFAEEDRDRWKEKKKKYTHESLCGGDAVASEGGGARGFSNGERMKEWEEKILKLLLLLLL